MEGVPVAGKLCPAVPAAVEHQARKPGRDRADWGRAAGARRPPRGQAGAGGAPPAPTGEPPGGLASNCEKSRRPRERSTCGGGLGFLLLRASQGARPAIPDKALKLQEIFAGTEPGSRLGTSPSRRILTEGGRRFGDLGEAAVMTYLQQLGPRETEGTGLRLTVRGRALPSLPRAAGGPGRRLLFGG